MSSHPKIVCLMGPTASGKTQLAIDLVQHFPFEIISVDSAMVYRGMDIGTAKPSPDLLKIAPHRLINIRDPQDAYSAAQFRADALREIKDILQQGKIPLLVGGTMLYFKALQQGLTSLPSANPAVRARLSAAAETEGWPALHQRLAAIDAVSARRIHPHDAQRIQRALEVYELTHKNLTAWHADEDLLEAQYDIYHLAIAPLERLTLHERIEERFQAMLAAGFIAEVQALLNQYELNVNLPAMRSVGYRQALNYLAGDLSYEDMCQRSIIATRQLAKRQLTWLRHWPDDIFWLDSLDENLFETTVDFLKAKKIIS